MLSPWRIILGRTVFSERNLEIMLVFYGLSVILHCMLTFCVGCEVGIGLVPALHSMHCLVTFYAYGAYTFLDAAGVGIT